MISATNVAMLDDLRGSYDPTAWKIFVEKYTPFLYEAFRKRGIQPTDAEDLVQEVFTKLLSVMPTFQYNPSLRFRGYLLTIATRTLYSSRKRWSDRVLRAATGDAAQLQETDPLEEITEAECRAYQFAQAARIARCDFEAKTWQAVWETVVEQRPAAEVAAELGMTVAAVYAAKPRVIHRLRAALSEFVE